MAFDPNEYLAKKKAELSAPKDEPKTGFDPEAYLESKKDVLSDLRPKPVYLDEKQVAQEIEDQFYSKNPLEEYENQGARAIIGAAGKAGEIYDRVTGAPIRTTMSNLLLRDKQYDYSNPPSGEQQAVDIGFEEGGLPAKAVGFGLEMIQDPFLIGGLAAKGISKGAGALKNTFKGLAEREADQFGQPLLKQAAEQAQEQTMEAGARGAARASAQIEGGAVEAEQSGKLFDFKQPKSIEELRQWKPDEKYSEIPQMTRLKEADANLPDFENKPLELNYKMLEDPKAMKRLKLEFDNLPEGDAVKLAQRNNQMVMEAADKTRSTIEGISGAPSKDYSSMGNDLINTVGEKYRMEQEALAPIFDTVKKRSGRLNKVNSRDLIIGIGETQPKIGKALIQDETGRFSLKPHTKKMGMSKKDYELINDTISDLNDGVSFEDLQNIRASLFEELDNMGPKTSQTAQLRKTLLEQMKDLSRGYGDDVQKAFQGYAKNEEMRENFENIIGGRIESLNKMYKANPDKVVDAVFSDPNYVDLVKEYIGPEKFNELLQAKIESGISKAFDPVMGFKPQVVRQFLYNKNNALLLNKSLDPATYQRLKDLADVGYMGRRFLDEVNPSGTAASFASMLEPKGFMQKIKSGDIKGAIMSEAENQTLGRFGQKQSQKFVNEMMGTPQKSFKQDILDLGSMGASAVESGTKKVYDFIRDKYMPVKAGQVIMKENYIEPDTEQEPIKSKDETILEKAKGSKYEQALLNAKQNGQQSLAAAIFVLNNRDPEFRKITS